MATLMAEYAIFFAISSVQITLSLLLLSVIMSSDRICSRSGAERGYLDVYISTNGRYIYNDENRQFRLGLPDFPQ